MLTQPCPPPLVAAIHDLSGFGRCSLSVALPILAVMGVQCCPLPTALLSNHTGYESFFFMDCTDKISDYYQQWLKLKLNFAAIYSGFLGSERQVELVAEFIKAFQAQNQSQNQPLPLILIDPVMGDHGNIYTTYTPPMCQKMKQLIPLADIITPNLTEAYILLEQAYQQEEISLQQAKEMAAALGALGPKIPILTGLRLKGKPGVIANLAYNRLTKEYFLAEEPLVPQHFNGTGDVFAAVLCGGLIGGLSTQAALKKAANFVYECTSYTMAHQGKSTDGIMIERFLKTL